MRVGTAHVERLDRGRCPCDRAGSCEPPQCLAATESVGDSIVCQGALLRRGAPGPWTTVPVPHPLPDAPNGVLFLRREALANHVGALQIEPPEPVGRWMLDAERDR